MGANLIDEGVGRTEVIPFICRRKFFSCAVEVRVVLHGDVLIR